MSERGTVLRPGVRAAVWLVLGISTVATLVAILFQQRLSAPLPGARDSYGEAPTGHRALLETLTALGMHVIRERRGDVERIETPILYLEPEGAEAIVDGQRIELGAALEARATAGLPSIVVLPKWTYAEGTASLDPEASTVLEAVLPGSGLRFSEREGDAMTGAPANGPLGAYEVAIPYRQWIEGGSATVLLDVDGQPLVLERYDGVLVVSDPDLVHNWNIHRADHARLMLDLIRHVGGEDTVVIDEVFHGHGERRSLASALAEPPAVWVTAQALLLLGLVVWMGSRRFGPARDLTPTVHGPAESIAVSAFVLAEGRPLERLTESYVHALLAELAERLGVPPGKSPREHAAHIDVVAARRGETVRASALLERAEILGRTRAARADAMNLAREAHAFRTRLLARG